MSRVLGLHGYAYARDIAAFQTTAASYFRNPNILICFLCRANSLKSFFEKSWNFPGIVFRQGGRRKSLFSWSVAVYASWISTTRAGVRRIRDYHRFLGGPSPAEQSRHSPVAVDGLDIRVVAGALMKVNKEYVVRVADLFL